MSVCYCQGDHLLLSEDNLQQLYFSLVAYLSFKNEYYKIYNLCPDIEFLLSCSG